MSEVSASKIYGFFLATGIHKATSIEDQPSVQLVNWTIKRTTNGSFFVGDAIGAAGRVSTDIVEFDETTKRGRTRSGRVYELVGNEGHSSNGEYVWSYYKQVNNLTELPG
jgi:hypothetical protein